MERCGCGVGARRGSQVTRDAGRTGPDRSGATTQLHTDGTQTYHRTVQTCAPTCGAGGTKSTTARRGRGGRAWLRGHFPHNEFTISRCAAGAQCPEAHRSAGPPPPAQAPNLHHCGKQRQREQRAARQSVEVQAGGARAAASCLAWATWGLWVGYAGRARGAGMYVWGTL